MKKEIDPKMHSAEHILNQTMVRMFGCGRCFSAHIERRKSKCDYHFDRNLTEEETARIEEQVNGVIRADIPVTEESIAKAEAEKFYNMERVLDEAGDHIRIVRVGDYDACPCVGVHVPSTGEIGTFRITSSSHENGVLRIRFKLAPV